MAVKVLNSSFVLLSKFGIIEQESASKNATALILDRWDVPYESAIKEVGFTVHDVGDRFKSFGL